MPQPFDYAGGIGAIADPGAAFQQGILGAQQQQQNANIMAAQQAKLQAEAQRQAQYQAALKQAINNPSAQNFATLSLINPEAHEAIKSGWNMLDKDTQTTALRDLSSVYGYATSGNIEATRKVIQNHIDANKAAGQDTSQFEGMIGLLDDGPEGVKKVAGIAGVLLSSAVPDKFAETFKNIGDDERADALLPAQVAKGASEAITAKVEADKAPEIVASKLATEKSERDRKAAQTSMEKQQLALGWERLGLDKDALTTNTQLKIQELLQAGAAVTGASLEELTKAVGSSQQSQALAERSETLAKQFEQSNARGGAASGWAEWLKTQTGNQDAVSALRTQYDRLKNSIAVKNLPPGSASDKDVVFALKGFPAASTSPEYIAQFLRGVAKMESLNAQADDRKADWISSNGNLGTAKRDLQVGGIRVPAGTTFGEFNRNAMKLGKASQAPERGYLERYGR